MSLAFNPYSDNQLPTRSYPETNLNTLLQRKDYDTILNSTETFRAAYLKTCLNNAGYTKHMLMVTLENHRYSVTAHLSSINYAIESIEVLRTLLAKKWRKRQNATLYCSETPICSERVVTKPNRIDDMTAKHVITDFKNLSINFPALSRLFEAQYEEKNFLLHGKKGILRTFTWAENRRVYLIPPKAIVSGNPLTKQLYNAYKNGEWCDFTLIASDQSAIKVHRVVLAVAGEFPKKCLLSGMIESQQQSIAFPTFSRSTLQAYADYLYLGGEEFIAKIASERVDHELNLMELLHFAHVHEEATLIDCCTNLLALSATTKECDDILEAAERYDLPYLKQLAAKLAPTVHK